MPRAAVSDDAPPVAGDGLAAAVRPRSWLARWRDWRNRLVADPVFQRRAAAFPLTRPLARRHARELFDLVAGFVYSQVLLACVRLSLFDRLLAGPLPARRLVAGSGLDDEAFDRLLDAAVALELLERRGRGEATVVALGRLGAPLAGQRAIAAMIEHHATLYADLADPLALLRRETQSRMAGFWPYAEHGEGFDGARLPADRVAAYSTLMSDSLPLVADEVLAQVNFRGHRRLLDVGGGEGTFLRAVAARAPRLELMLFDLPPVAERARAAFEAAGLGARATAFGGDFFGDALPAGADVISLVRVCFDHPDERVLALLKNVRRALPQGGTLVLAEPMAGVRGAEAMGDAYFGLYLMAMGRGRPRSAERLGAMLVEAGFPHWERKEPDMPLHTGVLIARCGPQNGA